MKGSVCSVCGFISIDGTVPERCPVCGAPKTAFSEKEDALKTASNVALPGESDKKHVPSIHVVKKCSLIPEGCTDVHIKVGEMTHPMLPEHFITRIDCYIDRTYVARVTLTPGKLNPAAALHLKASTGKFAAVENCNVHGSWFNEVDLGA